MSVFLLDCESVSGAEDVLHSLSSEMSNLSSTFSSYDTSCEDGFSFDSAKSVIAQNLEACAIKIQNTASVLESVVSSHTSLENSMKYEDVLSQISDESGNGTSTSTDTYNGGTTGTNGGIGNYIGGASGVAGGISGYNGGGNSSSNTPTTSTNHPVEATTEKVEEIKEKPKKVSYVSANTEKLTDESKKIFSDKDFKYKDGYAMIGERYVIACDASFGKVGDILRFTQKDGTVIECIIGINTVSEKYKDVISFIVDKNVDLEEKEMLTNLLKDNAKIERITKVTSTNFNNATQYRVTTVNGDVITNGNVINTNSPVGEGTKYNLSDDDLAHLAYVAYREQGSVEGAKLELSLMANLYEKNASKYSSVRDYVDRSGWFASGSRSGYTYPGDNYVAIAREVLNGGKRYLPSNVVEHDCISDLTYSSTGSVGDRSSYIPGQTILKNRYGATYKFVGFAPNGGDPFGYLV